MSQSGGRPVRVCVVVPTFNHASTLAAVVGNAQEHVERVIVVNDGSTDPTREVLEALPRATVITHERNLGKGAALRSAFAHASAHGFTHAITFDADGQHEASDIPRFLERIEAQPDAILIGVRGLAGRGAARRSRLLRFHSNFWVWLETGRWVSDSQSGFRAYPLARVEALTLRSSRYDYEIEVLVKLLWSGVSVVQVPISVHYGGESRSQFRPVRDFALVGWLNVRLLVRRAFSPLLRLAVRERRRRTTESTP